MIRFEAFKAGHLKFFKPQEAQRDRYWAVVQSEHVNLLEAPPSLSAWAGQVCVGAGGLLALARYRAVAWMILSQDASPYLLPIVRKIRRVVALAPYKRIELTVEEGFEQGEQFARLIGAVCETPEPMRYYGDNGQHERMFAIVNDHINIAFAPVKGD